MFQDLDTPIWEKWFPYMIPDGNVKYLIISMTDLQQDAFYNILFH